MGWFRKSLPLEGSVWFRGTLPQTLNHLELPQGTQVELMPVDASMHWMVQASHPTLGEVTVASLRNISPPPPAMFAFDTNITVPEQEDAAHAGSGLMVRMPQSKGHLLRDRKRFLTFLGAILGKDGLFVLDHTSMRPWSRALLDDELAHDADVDVSALFALHGIGDDSGERCIWLHTHGLNALGKYDFDIIQPHEAIVSNASDLIRSIAFASLEDKLKPGTANWMAFHPGGVVSAVDARTFDAKAPAADRDARMIPNDDDGVHTRSRFVLCDPAPGRLARLFRSGVRASSALKNFPPDRGMIMFSNEATDLASQRAVATFGRFREMCEATQGMGLSTIVKIGIVIDGGGPTDREHMWFEVNRFYDDQTIDATLIVQPFDVARMKEGDRGRRGIEGLSDWSIMTPLGPINPRTSTPFRVISQNADLQQKLREFAAKGAES